MKRKYVLIVIGSSLLFGIAAAAGTPSNSTYSSLGISPTATPTSTRYIKDCMLEGTTQKTMPATVPDSEKVETVPRNDELSDELTPEDAINILKRNDRDNDGVCDYADNCEDVYNPKQKDKNKNGIGDACEPKRKPKIKERKS